MIKAEVISHEGNVGPNWLEHCRSLATPGRITALVIVLAGTVFISALTQDQPDTVTNLPPTSVSQQVDSLATGGLVVQPLKDATSTAPTAQTANVQSASGNSAATTGSAALPQNNPLGAGSTPSLNNAATPANATQAPSGNQNFNGSTLVNTVQTTLNQVDSQLLKPLGLGL